MSQTIDNGSAATLIPEAKPIGRPLRTVPQGGQSDDSEDRLELDLLGVIKRQAWTIAFGLAFGLAGAAWYYVNSQIWYDSTAKILVSQRDPRAATGGYSEGGPEQLVEDDILANHMEIIQSPRIVETALARRLGEFRSLNSYLASKTYKEMDSAEGLSGDTEPRRVDDLGPSRGTPEAAEVSANLLDPISASDPRSAGTAEFPVTADDDSGLDRMSFDAAPSAVASLPDEAIEEDDDTTRDLADEPTPIDDLPGAKYEDFSVYSANTRIRDLPSIQKMLNDDETATEYVTDHLKLTAGGGGAASSARSLNVTFSHVDAADTKLVLEAIVTEYQRFLDKQLEDVSSYAVTLVNEARDKVERELRDAEADYVFARRGAPLLFSGEGSGSVYTDKFRKLEDELLDIEISETSTRTRLETALESLRSIEESSGSDLEKLALIDGDSLERLGTFAQIRGGASQSIEFLLGQSERTASARTEYDMLLELKAEERTLRRDFGENYRGLQEIREKINLIEDFLSSKEEKMPKAWAEANITPESLLTAYVGFLKHDLAAFAERRNELKRLAEDAERNAKLLIEFELKDEQLRADIERKEELFAGIVDQLRELNTASAFSGFTHELLDRVRFGKKSWPSLPICFLGGLVFGGLLGASLAAAFDQFDNRFRSIQEVEETLNVRVLGCVPSMPPEVLRTGQLAASTLTPAGEAFRTIRTILKPQIRNGENNLLAVTSAMPGDGKSTMMANIAVAFGQIGSKVLLIDADLRRPTAHKLFKVKEDNGLVDIVRDGVALAEAVKPSGYDNVSLVTAGAKFDKPSELLQSQDFVDLLAATQLQYDLVLVDVGPVLAVSDSMIVGQHVDGVLFVSRVEKDKISQVSEAVKRMRSGGVKILGCVINAIGAEKDFAPNEVYYKKHDYHSSSRLRA